MVFDDRLIMIITYCTYYTAYYYIIILVTINVAIMSKTNINGSPAVHENIIILC